MNGLARSSYILAAAVALFTSVSAAAQPPTTPVPPPPPETTAPPETATPDAAQSQPPAPAAAQPVANANTTQPVEPPPLPSIPAAPTVTLPDYPNCRDEYLTLHGRVAQASLIYACINRLIAYDRDSLQPVADRVARYREGLGEIWRQVNDSTDYSHDQKVEFYGRISAEFEKSRDDGTYLDEYRAREGRYRADRVYLRAQYCNLVTCRPGG